jgi:hypothetical protein
MRDSATSVGMTMMQTRDKKRIRLQFVRIRKPPQDRVLTRRSKIFNRAPEYRIEKRICVHHVEVERDQFAIEMQLRLII